MKIRPNFSSAFIFLLLFCLIADVNSQVIRKGSPADQTADAQTAVAEVREFYKMRDYESGYESGRKLTEQFPDNLKLQAWFILNMARNEMSKDAVEAAKKLVEKNRENAWAHFALAHAYIRDSQTKEAASAAEKALQLAPDDEEFIFLYGSSLLLQKKYDEIYALLDKNSSKIKDQSRWWLVKAETEYRQATGEKTDEAKKKLSFESFAKARDANPNSVNAVYIYGTYLNYAKRYAESLPLLKRAVALSPKVAHIRQAYWRAILNGQPDKAEEQRNAEVVADINKLLRLYPDSASLADAAYLFYETELEMPDKKKELETAILKKFPQSVSAERISINKIRRFDAVGKDKKVDEEKRRQRVSMLKDFIKRPKHHRESYLGEAYTNLFYEIKDDKTTSDAELLQVAENASKIESFGADHTHSMIAKAFANRKMFREAEKFVGIGFEKVKKEIERQRAYVKDAKELEKNSDSMNAVLHNALGWTRFKENRLDEAVKELESAIKLNAEATVFYNDLAQVYEAKNELDRAETAYINAYSTFYGKENPNFEALKSLYRKRHQNLENFEAYFETVKVTERAMRKERVLSAKIKEPKNATPFNLKNLEAKPLQFADLKGKVVVVNIWGTWCGPCVMEMPEFQELHVKYRSEKDVAILTINNDEDLETIKKFMTDKKYDFAVLRDENYLQTVGINAFPTTWFIDRDGKISYIKIGATDKLLEEFGWRIEELRKQNEGK